MEDVNESGMFELENSLKSLAFASNGQIFVAVVPGEARLDYRNFARACGVGRKSLRTLSPDEVESRLGDVPGGVSPFHHEEVNVVFDQSVPWMTKVTCGGGDPEHTIELEAHDLLRTVRSTIAPIAAELIRNS